jgi:hypothetical protein
MEKTFTRAGTSILNGVKAYRFANDLNRERVLAKNDHTEINFIELGEAMTKEAAILFLNSKGITAEANRVTAKVTAPKVRVASVKPAQTVQDTVDDDGFVEPKDEAIQVAMTRLAQQHPGMSAENLYKQVMLTVKQFGDTEPNF